MEQIEAIIPEGELNGFCGIYSTDQESDFMSQLFGNCSVPNETSSGVSNYEMSSNFYPSHEPNMISIVSGGTESAANLYDFSRGGGMVAYSGCSSTSFLFPTSSHESYYNLSGGDHSSSHHHQFLAMSDSTCMSIDFCVGDDKNTVNLMEESGGSMEDSGEEDKVVVPLAAAEPFAEEEKSSAKKRSRVSGDVQKKRNVKPKKNQKVVDSSDDESKAVPVLNRQNSSTCCSEDELKPSALNISGKTRASRGSATDPQSLYARKRRERINERLRILQNLVPNGTKVDISTMLEEAVQYVKFLQLQIKLLSSDDMWMYAPIAYNGMDLGLDRTTQFIRG